MTKRTVVDARKRDAIVADLIELSAKHGLSPRGLSKFVPFAMAEMRSAERHSSMGRT